jgi:hypothetical protein
MKNKIVVLKDWRLKKPIHTEMDGDLEKVAYSLQVLEKNDELPLSIRVAQNIVLHNIEDFESFGVFKNKDGSRMRFYCWSHMVYYFKEKIVNYKCIHKNKEEMNDEL